MKDREDWHALVHGATKRQTQLAEQQQKDLNLHFPGDDEDGIPSHIS